MSMEAAPPGAVSPRADFWSALAWIVFGGAVAVGSWRMDRLANLHINRYEVPGLVPGLLGATIFLLGCLLAARALRHGALLAAGAPAPAEPGARRYIALVLGAMLFYALVLVGRGLPFWLATGAFVTAFIYGFDRPRQAALGRSAAGSAVLAAVCGVTTSAVVTLVFQHVFYVRLP